DEALLAVLASPLVGVSNDCLVLLRRAAPKRPLFVPFERGLPNELSEDDERLCKAFLQRFERLSRLAPSVSLERLVEAIVAEHDYDLAVLAQWDGRRRYANMRKLARLARSYEELRGPDIEGFVRFVRDQEQVGAKELEAVAEEEGADAVRLLTIHGAKGLEFKVVVVADAGRDRAAPSPDEILCLPDGRFGFRVADPATGQRRGAFEYEAVREAERTEEEAERLRLYYVAMTRAIDRLIVSGAIDPEKSADAATPIGWVLGRLEARELEEAGERPLELVREGARVIVRLDRRVSQGRENGIPTTHPTAGPPLGQLELFAGQDFPALLPPAPALPPLAEIPAPPLHRVRRLSYSALALFERCSYRYYAERVVGMRPAEAAGSVPGQSGLAATEIGDAVHVLLELETPQEDLRELALARYPGAGEEDLARIEALVQSWRESALARRLADLPGVRPELGFAFEHDGVLLHGRFDLFQLEGERALVVDYKTNLLEELSPAEVVEAEYGLQRLVYALAAFRAGAEEVEVAYVFLEQPEEVVTTTFVRAQTSELETQLSEAIRRIGAGDFRPTPSEFACTGCPALDVVCAGPRLLVAA
ncbi:MAG: PD-(D/E)XK nuclease family protein, partial [Gaiellaceae bacterium]